MNKIHHNPINEINETGLLTLTFPRTTFTLENIKCEFNVLKIYLSFSKTSKKNQPYQNCYRLSVFGVEGEIKQVEFIDTLKDSEYFNEARIIILGEKGAGKTSLARKLVDPGAPLSSAGESTPGVDVILWELKESDINVRIWDFAGHTITHALHRIFLGERSIYIIVYDGRSENRNRLEYWLNHVQIYGDNSNAFILVNEIDENKVDIPINRLKEKFNIIDLHNLNLGKDKKKFKQFRAQLKAYVKDSPIWEKSKIKRNRYQVKETLENIFNGNEENKNSEYLSKDEFNKIAMKHGVEDPDQLLNELNNLGFCLWNEKMLDSDTLILNPEWISQGIYQIINWVNKHNTYKVILSHFSKVFETNLSRFPVEKHQFLFDLMKEYELAYESDNKDIIIPHLLNEDQPKQLPVFKIDESLMLKYKADSTLPDNTIPRFIVRHHQQIKIENAVNQVWRYGVILQNSGGNLAMVREEDRTITVEVKGSDKTQYLNELKVTIDDILDVYKSKKPELDYRIRLFGEVPVFLSEKQIKNYVRADRPFFDSNTSKEIRLEQTVKDYEIKELYKLKSNKVKVFFSYSHKDEDYKNGLDIHLSALKRNNKIETWNDHKIIAGQEWDNIIKIELAEADVILLLVSADFIASNYIWEVEIKKAIDRHNQGKAKVIPVYCRICDFGGMPFEMLKGLPENRKPINTFEDKDQAYFEIVEGVKATIKDLTEL